MTSQTTLPGPAPRNDAWKVIGPGGGGTMIGPTLSPHDPNLAVEHCDMTGAYITTDGGLSWRMFNLRSVVNCFAFDPNRPEVIYAGNAALWRSDDRGKTWAMLLPDPSQHTVEHMGGDHADWFVTSDDPDYPGPDTRIAAVAVDPVDSDTLYLALSGPAPCLLASADGGQSWRRLTDLDGGGVLAFHAARSSTAEACLVIVQPSALRVRRHGLWERLLGPAGAPIRAAAVGEEGAKILVYVTGEARWGRDSKLAGAVHVSEDCGRTWRAANEKIGAFAYQPGVSEAPQFRAVACSAQHAATAYLGFRGLSRGTGIENVFSGIMKTTDGGRTWSIVHAESNQPSDNLESSWIESRAVDGYPNIWFDPPYSLGVAPAHPEICYATDLFRTYRTQDGGETWQQVNSVRLRDDLWTTRGLDVTTCYGVHFDPFEVRHVFISYTDIGLFQSPDGGKSWRGSSEGIPNEWRNTTYWIEFDPEVKGLLWGVFSGTHDLPRPKMWRGTDPDRYRGGVAISHDGGLTWTPSSEGMMETAATHLLLDPASPAGERTLYVCGFGRGVYKSTDNGQNWELKNEGIDGRQPFAWRLTRAEDGTLYLVVARRSDDGSLGTPEDGALYRSTDGAEQWTKLPLPAGCNGPVSLTLDPTDNQRMYLSAWGRTVHPDDDGGGVFLSTDGGQTWQNIFSQSQHIYDVTVDLKHPNLLYACGFDSAAYRSADAGQTWERLKGYRFKWGHRVVLDPVEASKIYITTFGGSVWHGPARGDPDAGEDIATEIGSARW